MARDNTLIIPVLSLPVTRRHHCEVTFVSRLEHVKEFFCVLDLIMLVRLRGHAHDVRGCEARQATLRPRIGAMELGPGLFEETNPELTVSARRERWLTIGSAWQVLIDEDRRFLSVQEESNHVDARLVDLLGDKHGLDSLWELGERAQRGQKVAVAQLALVDVVRLDAVLEDEQRVVDVTGTLPSEFVVGRGVCLQVYFRIVERLAFWRELRVSPRLSLLNNLVHLALHGEALSFLLVERGLRLLRHGLDVDFRLGARIFT